VVSLIDLKNKTCNKFIISVKKNKNRKIFFGIEKTTFLLEKLKLSIELAVAGHDMLVLLLTQLLPHSLNDEYDDYKKGTVQRVLLPSHPLSSIVLS
jgi:hypothetical protein